MSASLCGQTVRGNPEMMMNSSCTVWFRTTGYDPPTLLSEVYNENGIANELVKLEIKTIMENKHIITNGKLTYSCSQKIIVLIDKIYI